ncbi:M48 family metallopeptidase [Kitasatospora sp. NPDC086801]|uniref:M48 family metallopeptidase n=1 Tax=Kitasatospora sp. NPDC086801 TaxID=3364066 RepID=UPI00380756AA
MTVRGIAIDIVYKNIKNLHIGVYPPMGRVRVAAPLRLDDEQVRLAVIQRLAWIKKQREQLRSVERQSQRGMTTGESHYIWGQRYRLKVVERPGRAHVEVESGRLLMYVPPGSNSDTRSQLLQRWQREQLRLRVPALIAKWEPVIERDVSRLTIRRMKTKWGSCSRESGHISLNLELAKKHPDCLEYVIVHEMTHLHERSHGQRFIALLDKYMPTWRARRDQLNESPLAEEEWSYPQRHC